MTGSRNIRIELLEFNTGQIKGVAKNPRKIKDPRYKKLVKSMKEFPELLHLRELIVFPLGKKFITLAGNQRLRGGKELKHKSMPCKVLDKNTGLEILRKIVIVDNAQFGEDDWELLQSEWDEATLIDWGIEIPGVDISGSRLGTAFELKAGDKNASQQMAFQVSSEQAGVISRAIARMKATVEFKKAHTKIKSNVNALALYMIIKKWDAQKK